MNPVSRCRSLLTVLLLNAGAALTGQAASETLTIDAAHPAARVSPTLFGIFFEEINCAGDGGLYAEMVRNRSFEDGRRPEHWYLLSSGGARGEIVVDPQDPLSLANPHSLRLTIRDVGNYGWVGAANNGYWGMAVRAGQSYKLSLWARRSEDFVGSLAATLESTNGQVYAREAVVQLLTEWRQYRLTLTATGTDPAARLVLRGASRGSVWMDMVSLFPQPTWKGRTNGLRPDLANMLADLKPSFVRFPGGCWVEGDTLPYA